MLDETKTKELKAAYPELIGVEAPNGITLVFRKPKRLEYDQWFDNRNKGSQYGLQLAQQCLVHPTLQDFMNVLEAYPAILQCGDGVVDAITDMCGADGTVTKKKL